MEPISHPRDWLPFYYRIRSLLLLFTVAMVGMGGVALAGFGLTIILHDLGTTREGALIILAGSVAVILSVVLARYLGF